MVHTITPIPTDYEPINFAMNPETDDLIRSEQLEEGMIVLAESSVLRENPVEHVYAGEHECDPYRCGRVEETARWCQVTSLKRRDHLISFIGVYADGTKRLREYNRGYCWFVKVEK